MRLLGAKYKTLEGARKRAAFENGVAPGEYRRGDKARLYRHTVQRIDGMWRVARAAVPPIAAAAAAVDGRPWAGDAS